MLSGCSLIGNLIGGQDDVFSIEVGDCFNDSTGTDEEGYVSGVDSVACSEAHDNEVYSVFTVDGDDYPGEEAVMAEADSLCSTSFEEFVGVIYDESELYLTYLYPTDQSWSGGDKEIVCVIYEDGAKTTGTLASANR
jgi:hypothetical protein